MNLIQSVEKLKDFSKGNQGTSQGWIAALIAGVLAIIVIGVLAFRAWQLSRERAALLHEQRVAEEKAHQASVDMQLASNGAELVAAIEDHDEAVAVVKELRKAAEDLKQKNQEAKALLEMVVSWEALDQLLEEHK